MSRWLEVGPDNYVLTTQGSLLNTGLVVGSERALVIDTGSGPRQGREILDAVREKTQLPLVVVNTHAHYDHFFGNAVFADAGVTEFWAHENCAAEIDENGDSQRRAVAADEPEMAAGEGDNTELVVPNAIVKDQPVLAGPRRPDRHASSTSATDTPTATSWWERPPPSSPGTWWSRARTRPSRIPTPRSGRTSSGIVSALRHRYEFLVPGHGEPCSDQFVKTMANTMTTAVRQATQATRETPDDATKAIPILPYGPEQSRWFIKRLQETRAHH